MKNKKNLLVIVDMVNGFVKEGPLADNKINSITPQIIKIMQKAIDANVPIVAFKDCHQIGDKEFEQFPVHCLEGTNETELIAELKPNEKHFIVINKNTTNGFITPEFLKLVKNFEFEKVVVVGCCIDICVENFVTSFVNFNKQYNRKTQIIIPETAVSTFDLPNHNAERYQAEALKRMEEIGVKILSKSKESTVEKI